jgi:hypothetical protein
MAVRTVQLGRPVLVILAAWGLLSLAGCGGPKLVPVSGAVTLDGKPLSHGAVSFNADASKGNTVTVSCLGRLNEQGQYQLKTIGVKKSDSGTGAPLGWYKVTLFTGLPGEPEITVNPKYLDPTKTPLSVEVVENPTPGQYDFKLTK